MDFDPRYTPEAEGFRRELREWLRGRDELRATSDEGSGGGRAAGATGLGGASSAARDLWRGLASRRWAAPSWPRRYGGGGLSPWHDLVLQEELLAAGAPMLAISREVAGAIRAWGDERQRRELLPRMLRADCVAGRLFGCLRAIADPQEGVLSAAKDGDVYLISGEDEYSTDEAPPTHLIALAATDPGASPRARLSAFLIPAGLPGVSFQQQELPGRPRSLVLLRDVVVPAEWRIGREGDGWLVARSAIDLQASAGRVLAEHRRGVEALLRHVRKQSVGTKPGGEPSKAGELIAEAYIEAQVLRLLALRNRWLRASSATMTFHEPQHALLAGRAAEALAGTEEDILGPHALLPGEEWPDPAGDGAVPVGIFEDMIASALAPEASPKTAEAEPTRRAAP